MTNKHWKEILNGFGEKLYILYFTPFDNEEELIRFTKDNNGDYVYTSELLNVEDDYLDCYIDDSISVEEEAKQICEELIEEHYEDEINYYEELLRLFKEQ